MTQAWEIFLETGIPIGKTPSAVAELATTEGDLLLKYLKKLQTDGYCGGNGRKGDRFA